MKKKVILNIESVYTANAFQVGTTFYVAAGSETKPEVYLYNLATSSSDFVSGCPGGVMSFIPTPGNPDLFFSVMGLFPPFIGAEAGIFMHRKTGSKWVTQRAFDLPFAHRCEIVNHNGTNFLFAAAVSKYKQNPQDWSKPGEMHLIRLNDNPELPLKSKLIDDSLTRNHGMLRYEINGNECVFMSGAEGIFYFEPQSGENWVKKQLFENEVSEFCFVDFDGDGINELVTIEPFHGETLNVYKKTGEKWELKFSDFLSFGHGLSGGIFNNEPVIVVGSRRGSYALDMFKITDTDSWKFTRNCIEEDAGPTQTQVFSDGKTDYILSANQKKNEVALYY